MRLPSSLDSKKSFLANVDGNWQGRRKPARAVDCFMGMGPREDWGQPQENFL